MNQSLAVVRALLRRLHAQRAKTRRRITSAVVAVALLANLAVPVVPAVAATPPTANAGADVTVPSGTRVVLDGSASTVAPGQTPSYLWTQVGGPTVTLSGANTARPTVEFFAPLVASATQLEFELTVSDAGDHDTDTVKVTVVPASLPKRLSLQPGRSGMHDIVAVGRTVYVAWCYRNGGALETWFARSFDGGATYEIPQKLALGGDCQYPKIAVEGNNVYVAWRQYVVLPSTGQPGSQVALASNGSRGSRSGWELQMLGADARDTSAPELAASTTKDGSHNVFVLFQAKKLDGNPLVLATSRNAANTFTETEIEPNASDQSSMRALAAHGDYAYAAYPTADKIKLYSRSASTGAEKRGSFSDWGGRYTQMVASPDGRLCVAWQTFQATDYDSRFYASASVLTTSTMSGTRTPLKLSDATNQCAPEIAWTGDSFMAAWVDMAEGIQGGQDNVAVARVRSGGGLTDAKTIRALQPRPSGTCSIGALATIAGGGGMVAAGWWDQEAGGTCTVISRDGGVTFDSGIDLGTWTGDSGDLQLASNGSTETPAIQAAWGGNLRWENNDVHCDVYTKRLAAVADNNLALEHLQVVQAPWDDTPTQRLARDKKTAFRLDIANGYDVPVTTKAELRYTQVIGGVPSQTLMTQDVTLAPYDSKTIYFESIVLNGESVSASATLNPTNSPAESERADNEAELSSRPVVETQKIDALYVPIVLPGDKGPDTAAFYSAVGSWGRFIAEAFPIDDSHWLAESRPTFNWTPELAGYAPGTDLTDDQYDEMEKQLAQLAKASGHETALGFVRPKWFEDRAPADYKDAVGLAPFGGTKHVGVEQVGQPAQIGGHEIAHTYGLLPKGTPGDMPKPNDGHFDQVVATGYSASRGEMSFTDPKNPILEMMQYTAVPNSWIGTVSYYLLMDRLSAIAADSEVVLLTGDCDRAAMTGVLDPAYRLDSEADVELGTTGDLQFVFKDGADAVLDSAGFDPSFARTGAGLSGSSEGDLTSFSVKVPWVPGTEKIELVYDGTVMAPLLVSDNAPTVTISTPAAGAAYSVGETVTVNWSGSDADGGTLNYLPMLSVDDGSTWTPLGGETTDTTCEFVPTRQFVTQKARVKVLVTDGVNSGEDVTGAFAIRPVVPTGAGGGGVPTWGPVLGFPRPTGIPEDINTTTWAMGANGNTVYLGWVDVADEFQHEAFIRVRKSTDRGTTWGPAVEVSGSIQQDLSGEDANKQEMSDFQGDTICTISAEKIDNTSSKLVFRRSTNGAASLDTSSVVTTWQTPYPKYPTVKQPRMVVDGERVYVLTQVITSSSTMALWLFKSTDGGTTWSGPVEVVEGPWNGPGAVGLGSGRFAVDADNVYVTYRRGNTNTFGPPDAGFVLSTDGGETFLAPVVAIENVHVPNVAAEDGHVYVAAYYWESSTSSGLKVASSSDYGGTFGTVQDLGSGYTGDYSDDPPPSILTQGEKATVIWRGRMTVPSNPYFRINSATSSDGGATFAPVIDLLGLYPATHPAHTDYTAPRRLLQARAQGDSLYVATQYPDYWDNGDGSGAANRLAVFTSTDFGTSYGSPEVTVLDPTWEDTWNKTVLAAAPGLVFAGVGVETYFTDYSGFLRAGSTGSAPAIAAGDDLAVSEGQPTSLTADFSADDVTGATATVDWGDGTVSNGIVAGSGTTGTVEAAHAYGTYGVYEAKVRLGVGGQSAEDTFSVEVANVAPSVSAPGTSTTTVGLPWQSEGLSFSDAGWDDALTATIDWGDGTTEPATLRVTSPGGNGEAQAGSIDATHTYSTPDTYTVLVTVDDGADATAATFSVVAESNNPPVADAGGPYTAYEGALFSLDASASTDPDLDALSFDWKLDGKGIGSPMMDNRSLSMRFADNGSHGVTLTARDGRGGSTVEPTTLDVLNVAPSVDTTAPRSITLHGLLAVPSSSLVTFSDPGVLDTHTALVNWGDGTTSAGIVDESGGSGRVLGGHTYAAPGDYTVTVTVTDKDGGSGFSAFRQHVAAANTAPVTWDVSVATSAGVAVPVDLSASDADGDALTWLPVPVVAPTSGTLADTPPALVYTPNAGFVGTDLFAFQVSDGLGGTATAHVTVTVTPVVVPTKVVRVTGSDRYQLALASSRSTFGAGSASRVVIASGERWDDPLAASGLAGTVRSPVLLAKRTSLPSGLVTELRRLGAKRIYLVGNTGSLSTGVTTKLKAAGFSVTRISGANRYEIAKNVAYKIEALRGNNKVTKAFVVRGDLPYDAMAVSSVAYTRKMPILYTPNKKMSAHTERAIRALDIDEIIIGGNTTAVSSTVARALKRLKSVDVVTRWGGTTAIATSIAVAKGALKRGWIGFGFVGMVHQSSWGDGLCASWATGYRRGPILLLSKTGMHSSTRSLLVAHRSEVGSVRVFARPSTIVDSVLTLVRGVIDQ